MPLQRAAAKMPAVHKAKVAGIFGGVDDVGGEGERRCEWKGVTMHGGVKEARKTSGLNKTKEAAAAEAAIGGQGNQKENLKRIVCCTGLN